MKYESKEMFEAAISEKLMSFFTKLEEHSLIDRNEDFKLENINKILEGNPSKKEVYSLLKHIISNDVINCNYYIYRNKMDVLINNIATLFNGNDSLKHFFKSNDASFLFDLSDSDILGDIKINLAHMKKHKSVSKNFILLNSLLSLFHEIEHGKQIIEVGNLMTNISTFNYPVNITYNLVLEELLIHYRKEFYDKNYSHLLSEKHADTKAYENIVDLITSSKPKNLHSLLNQLSDVVNHNNPHNKFIPLESSCLIDSVIKENPKILGHYRILLFEFDKDCNRRELNDIINNEKLKEFDLTLYNSIIRRTVLSYEKDNVYKNKVKGIDNKDYLNKFLNNEILSLSRKVKIEDYVGNKNALASLSDKLLYINDFKNELNIGQTKTKRI